jgi:hypothetical protein
VSSVESEGGGGGVQVKFIGKLTLGEWFIQTFLGEAGFEVGGGYTVHYENTVGHSTAHTYKYDIDSTCAIEVPPGQCVEIWANVATGTGTATGRGEGKCTSDVKQATNIAIVDYMISGIPSASVSGSCCFQDCCCSRGDCEDVAKSCCVTNKAVDSPVPLGVGLSDEELATRGIKRLNMSTAPRQHEPFGHGGGDDILRHVAQGGANRTEKEPFLRDSRVQNLRGVSQKVTPFSKGMPQANLKR